MVEGKDSTEHAIATDKKYPQLVSEIKHNRVIRCDKTPFLNVCE